jgi:hypothetical protein
VTVSNYFPAMPIVAFILRNEIWLLKKNTRRDASRERRENEKGEAARKTAKVCPKDSLPIPIVCSFSFIRYRAVGCMFLQESGEEGAEAEDAGRGESNATCRGVGITSGLSGATAAAGTGRG